MSIREIALRANLHRRFVVGAVTRLMHAGWVEIVTQDNAVLFRSTVYGLDVSRRTELPARTDTKTFWVKYAVDLVTGAVLHARGLTIRSEAELTKNTTRVAAVFEFNGIPEPYIIGKILRSNQRLAKIEDEGSNPKEAYALFRLEGDEIQRPPSEAPDEFIRMLKVASHESCANGTTKQVKYSVAKKDLFENNFDVHLDSNSLLVGGPPHQEAFESSIRNAKEIIIILTTFFNPKQLDYQFELLEQAALRNVRVVILWGKDGTIDQLEETKRAANELRDKFARAGLGENVEILRHSVQSHAKFLIADDGTGRIFSITGSCNWLASGFNSTEVSIRIEDGRFTSRILGLLERMVCAPTASRSMVAKLLTEAALKADEGRLAKEPNATVCVVTGTGHNQMMLRARDEARNRIIIHSHRISKTAESAVIEPMRVATQRGVKVSLIYERVHDKKLDGEYVADLFTTESGNGISIAELNRSKSRAHAKLLMWDRDHFVVTSQNWMSRDPSEDDTWGEVGIYVTQTGIVEEVLNKKHYKQLQFKKSRLDRGPNKAR